MELVSNSKYIRISPKKLKAVASAILGLTPTVAIDRLRLSGGKKGKLLITSIKTAAANATHNFKLNSANLRISRIEIGKGPFFKRWQPVSRGMAHQIKKRTSHIKVILQEIQPDKKLTDKKEEPVKKEVSAKG